jgi:hypothetical protein
MDYRTTVFNKAEAVNNRHAQLVGETWQALGESNPSSQIENLMS